MKSQTSTPEWSLDSTTRQHYITSVAALNIPLPEGTGDWHFSDCFIQHGDYLPKQQIAGKDVLSTWHLLGDLGIYDCTTILARYGASPLPAEIVVYAADHYRAIIDMIYDTCMKGLSLNDAIDLDDWFPEQHEKDKVFVLLDKLRPDLTDKQWTEVIEWKQITINES